MRKELVNQLIRSSGRRNTDRFAAVRDLSVKAKSVPPMLNALVASVNEATFIPPFPWRLSGQKLDYANPD
jgi:hypothetical protein